jgi:hypothetical protein
MSVDVEHSPATNISFSAETKLMLFGVLARLPEGTLPMHQPLGTDRGAVAATCSHAVVTAKIGVKQEDAR